MDGTRATWRRAAAAVVVALGLAAGNAQANWYESSFVKGRTVQVDVYDRASGSALPVYANNGRNYIVGAPGHEYGVRIRNCTGARVLVVTSVDGVNVISGDTASPSQSGYVLEPYGYVVITGWRKNMDRTAAFYFTDLGDSYAARTGRPQNVGVIGVAVFQERPTRIGYREQDLRGRLAEAEGGQPAERSAKNEARADAPPAPPASAPAQEQAGARDSGATDEFARQEPMGQAKALSKLGTGHGRNEESRVSVTRFDRATESPAETVAIQYDRRENLIAMGVLPRPTPYLARREPNPNPFPGAVRFAPDPR
jgi:hypothetical protein